MVHKLRFKQNQYEPCIFFKRTTTGHLVIAGVCTDDFRLLADLKSDLDILVATIRNDWDVRDAPEGEFMGVQVFRDRIAGTISLSQEKFIDQVLHDFNLSDCNPCRTPCAPATKLICLAPDSPVDPIAAAFPLRQCVGDLQWIQRNTVPEIAYSICQLSSFINRPTPAAVTAAKRILRYLKGIRSRRLTISRSQMPLQLETYVDSDFNGEPKENGQQSDGSGRRSISGVVIRAKGGGIISMHSTFQKKSASSTFEAEYICFAYGIQKLLPYRNILTSMDLAPASPLVLYEDNKACIASINSEAISSAARHIETPHCFLRQLQSADIVRVDYIDSPNQLADAQNKSTPEERFVDLTHRAIAP